MFKFGLLVPCGKCNKSAILRPKGQRSSSLGLSILRNKIEQRQSYCLPTKWHENASSWKDQRSRSRAQHNM